MIGIRIELPDGYTLKQARTALDRAVITNALEVCGGRRIKTAAYLGISRKHLWDLCTRYKLAAAVPEVVVRTQQKCATCGHFEKTHANHPGGHCLFDYCRCTKFQ